MSANEDLIDWNGHWHITNGVMSCRACQAQQKETDRRVAFVHSSACGYSVQRRNPWDDLDAICKKLSHTT
jgi:hypothetical protein